MSGLTPEQSTLLDERYCDAGHRIDGVNFPTADGRCSLCACPEIQEEVRHYWSLVGQSQRGTVHPSLLTHSER